MNKVLKIIVVIIGVLLILILLMQITGYKQFNLEYFTFDKAECIEKMNNTPDDQLGRWGKEDKLNDWQEICSRPSLFIKE